MTEPEVIVVVGERVAASATTRLLTERSDLVVVPIHHDTNLDNVRTRMLVAAGRPPTDEERALAPPGVPVVVLGARGGRHELGSSSTDALLALLHHDDLDESAARRSDESVLTLRELEVLELLGDDPDLDRVGAQLGISPHTARTHLQNAMRKLGATSRADAVRLALSGTSPDDDVPLALDGSTEGAQLVVAIPDPVLADAYAHCLSVDLNVRAEFATAVVDLASVVGKRTELVLLHASLPRALDRCAELKAQNSDLRVVIAGEEADRSLLRRVVEAGGDGYLAGLGSIDELAVELRKVLDGEAVIPEGMLGALLRDLIDRRRDRERAIDLVTRLSKRERTILALLVDGLDHEAMADRLYVSPHTARTHIQNVLRKLGVHSRSEAVTLVTDYDLSELLGGGDA